ncbi:unnamed protein product [Rhizophagus irregularis]|nr:unnamed protein product [Rhizophagus irregularis]
MKSNYGKDIHSKDMHIIQVLNIPSTQCVQDLFVSISCNFDGDTAGRFRPVRNIRLPSKYIKILNNGKSSEKEDEEEDVDVDLKIEN